MSIELSILTLNIWGIPWVSTDRDLRVQAIGDHLASGAYDVVSLQEVWSPADFERIRDRVATALPYSHYFYSGVLGSGLCVFSRHPIVRTLFHAWPVNGYVHRVHHGDWFGGKGVGLCQLNVAGGLAVNVYVAHLHAEYDREHDDYKAHRVLQAFDTAQFIAATRSSSSSSSATSLQVLAGDLNTEPGDLAYRTLLSVAELRDSCSQPSAGTNECSHNVYTAREAALRSPAGKRIDYILYRGGEGTAVETHYSLPLPHKLPVEGAVISYSDHEAVMARFTIRARSDTAIPDAEAQHDRLRNALSDCIHLCDETGKLLHSHRHFYLALAAAALVLLLSVMDAPNAVLTALPGLFVLVRLALVAVTLWALVMGTLWNWSEANALLGGRRAMEVALAATEKAAAAAAAS